MSDLEKIRRKIDKIDEEIVKLFEKRMEIILQVAKHKEIYNKPIAHQAREQEVLNNCKMNLENKEYEKELEELFVCLMSISRRAQAKVINAQAQAINAKDINARDDSINAKEEEKS